MRVDNGRQLDPARLDGLFQHGRNPAANQPQSSAHGLEQYGQACVLWRVRRVDYDGILGLVVDHEVGVVVAGPRPFRQHTDASEVAPHGMHGLPGNLIQRHLHMGIDWICMVRGVASF